MLVRPDDGRVHNQIFKVRIICHRLKQTPPDPVARPSREGPERAVPGAERRRQVSPGRRCPHDPQNRFHKAPAVLRRHPAIRSLAAQMRFDPSPLVILQNKTNAVHRSLLVKGSLIFDAVNLEASVRSAARGGSCVGGERTSWKDSVAVLCARPRNPTTARTCVLCLDQPFLW
jgi:hypothetical protein